ncbi:MAG: class I SAM-dependent methyltransferase [Acidobacteriota bacterium]
MVTLIGGEPWLRSDLEEIAGSFDAHTCLVLGTTGAGLTAERPKPALSKFICWSRVPPAASPAGPTSWSAAERKQLFENILICRPHPGSQKSSVTARLPRTHEPRRFFHVLESVEGQEVGESELQAAYDRVHADYDRFRLSAAAQPMSTLVELMRWSGAETVYEAGCGTGYATALLARHGAQGARSRFVRGDAVRGAGKTPLARSRQRQLHRR